MKKRNEWKWTLGATIVFVLATITAFTARTYEEFTRWPYTAAFAVVFAVLTVYFYNSVKKEQEAAAQRKAEEQARLLENEKIRLKARMEEEARRKAEAARFRYEHYAVAGVTFKNDDGTDRQKILREIALNDDGFAEVWFSENEDLGEDSGIAVLTEYGCVGFVRRSDKAKIRRFFGKSAQAMHLHVELFENEDNQKIYRADIEIVMKQGEPDQQWYFDELPEF